MAVARRLLLLGFLLLPFGLASQSAPALQFSAGYTRAFGSGGYGAALSVTAYSLPLGRRAWFEVAGRATVDHTGDFGCSIRSIFGVGAVAALRIAVVNAGLRLFATASVSLLSDHSGDCVTVASVRDAAATEDNSGSPLGPGVEFGAEQPLGHDAGLVLSMEGVHERLPRMVPSWLQRVRLGIRVLLH